MGDFNLTVELDDAGSFADTETLSGTVHVETDSRVEGGRLVVSRRWEAVGEGETNTGGETDVVVFEGDWDAGAQRSHRFELALPPGPYDRTGDRFDVEWLVEARAEIPLALDPVEVATFTLEPDGRRRYRAGQSWLRQHRERGDALVNPEGGASFFVALLLLMATAASIGMYFWPGVPLPVAGTLGGAAFLGLVWCTYDAVQTMKAEAAFGEIDADLASEVASPGDELACRVRMEPTRDLRLESCEAELTEVEIARTKPKGNEYEARTGAAVGKAITPWDESALEVGEAATKPTVRAEAPEASGKLVTAGERAEFRVELAVPHTDHYTFVAADNEDRWWVDLTVRTDGGLEWVYRKELFVRPAPSEQSS